MSIEITQYKTSDVFVSKQGDIFVKLPTFKSGYKGNYLSVSINGKFGGGLINGKHYIHRIVAETFIENPDNKPEVNHINNSHSDNRLENLEWNTRQENAFHHINGCNKESYKSRPTLSKKVINSDGVIFNSLSEASEILNIHIPNIVNCLKGKNQHCGGKSWAYYTEGCSIPIKPKLMPNGYSEKTYKKGIETKNKILQLINHNYNKIDICRLLKISSEKYYKYLTLET